jgi:hypothetical protein
LTCTVAKETTMSGSGSPADDALRRIADEAVDEAGFDEDDSRDARQQAKFRAYMLGQEKLVAAGLELERLSELDTLVRERIARLPSPHA